LGGRGWVNVPDPVTLHRQIEEAHSINCALFASVPSASLLCMDFFSPVVLAIRDAEAQRVLQSAIAGIIYEFQRSGSDDGFWDEGQVYYELEDLRYFPVSES
jgi:hypothetical protein